MTSQLWRPGYEPGDFDRFFLPDYWIAERARRMGVPIYQLLSHDCVAEIHAVNDAADAADLSYKLGGRAKKPLREIVVAGPGGNAIVIPGAGVTEAAELEDVAQEAYEHQEARLRAGKPIVDFEALREEAGLPSRKDFDPLFRQALRDRVARHRANPITDPEVTRRQPRGSSPVAWTGSNATTVSAGGET